VIFGVARAVGNSTQRKHVQEEDLYVKAVEARVAPPVRIAVAGADNSALTIEAPTASAAPAMPVPADATALYDTACHTCHGAGIGGAPKVGDKAAWAPRIAQGTATLYKHALEGFTGQHGVMPPKGGRTDLPDDLIKAGVDHMVALSR
jgi:cytochrome c5